MLKLSKIQILGFKSFCDRTEIQLSGEGMAAIVGPNGCGKSNISDAISWVLGEQSAKSLRGLKMEDVIFSGTKDRKPTGMAEVSLTLVDPEVYDGASLSPEGPELVLREKRTEETAGTSLGGESDWDEAGLRAQVAAETEQAVEDAQPGVTYETGAAAEDAAETVGGTGQTEEQAEAEAGADDVVLKIRRRKFNRTPVRAGEITVTRRLFRSGDSEYLLNGKLCRLRDIQDLFLGTGLGGESYALIGQERVAQLLSSKPLDRRAIIEEAAGITRFKTKKRLAELRLESARQNLSRIHDIFDEVTKQMNVLKRQAAKAERYGQVRDDLRARFRVVLASRMHQMDLERIEIATQVATLTADITKNSEVLEQMDAEHASAMQHGYALDGLIRETNTKANGAAVELERILVRSNANAERVTELTERIERSQQELAAAQEQIASVREEAAQLSGFLETASAQAKAAGTAAQRHRSEAQAATIAVTAAEGAVEGGRRSAMQMLQRVSTTRNHMTQAEAALAGLDRESERLASESEVARMELGSLGLTRGQLRLSFDSVTERLRQLEGEIANLRQESDSGRKEEADAKLRGDRLRGEVASLLGQRSSLEGLIKDHSYSTETVKNIFRTSSKRGGQAGAAEGFTPLGTLADFLEVEGPHGSMIDEFLRTELNYIVVRDWDQANDGIHLLQADISGRATFLVHADMPADSSSMATVMDSISEEGVTPLRSSIRLLDGLGTRLETLLPRLCNAYMAPDLSTARALAVAHPRAWFLAPSGETFHGFTVSGGRASASGPLALKRNLRDVQEKLEGLQDELSRTDAQTAALQRRLADLLSAMNGKTQERREAERESANSGAALRQIEAEASRIERRLQDWELSTGRNRSQREETTKTIEFRLQEALTQEREHASIEGGLAALQQSLQALREQREALQQGAAVSAAELAGLEERSRNAQFAFDQNSRLGNGLRNRIAQVEQQLASSAAEKDRREAETADFLIQHGELLETRTEALAAATRWTAEANTLRERLSNVDAALRSLRQETDGLRDGRGELTARGAKVESEIGHTEETCRNDLGDDPTLLRADTTVERLEGDALRLREEESRALKQKLDAMGPVNMMALEEYAETAERHGFLEVQRKDLLDSIENTQASIKEIDDVSRLKFDEAFEKINENFSMTFLKLFGGGQASMKLTSLETERSETDGLGIDILASPPGKKLQNILLLSGGEKALTALALLVGIFQYQPAPFCILDEVDAPLDETNVGRFARLVDEMSATTQFIVITHSKRTMAQADVIYGVTMQEPGVSKIISVDLERRREKSVMRQAVA